MSRRTFLLLMLLFLLAGGVDASTPGASSKPTGGHPRLATDLEARYYPYIDRPNYPQRLLLRLNAIRRAHQLPELQFSQTLGDVAQVHSTDMYIRNFVEHVNPNGEDHMARIRRYKPRLIVLQAKENLAWFEATYLPTEAKLIDEQFEGLMNSPPHREAILSRDITHVGFGYTIFWNKDRFEANQVQLFGDIAGEWVRDFPPVLSPGQEFELRPLKAIDVFLASESSPKGDFPDPTDRTRLWVGGLPFRLFSSRGRHVVRVPELPAGVYTVQCSPKGANRFVALQKVKVGR